MEDDLPPWPLLIVVIAAGVVLPGLLQNFVAQFAAGTRPLVTIGALSLTLEALVWILGYGSMVAIVYYGWIRPIDIGER